MQTSLLTLALTVILAPTAASDTGLSMAIALVLLMLIAFLAVLLILLLRRSLCTIPEGEVAVIERLGRFSRLAGPGLIWVSPKVEQIANSINIRLREEAFSIHDLWFRDVVQVDVDLTICYWLDLSGVEPDLLRDIAYGRPEQWRTTIDNRAKRILRDLIARYELMELIGHDDLCRQDIESTLARRLEPLVGEWGIKLKQPAGVWLRDIGLTHELQQTLNNMRRTDIDAKTKGAMVGTLREQYPEMSDLVLLSLFNMIGGERSELVHILPQIATVVASTGMSQEEIAREPSDQESRPSLEEPERDDSWRSLKPPPVKDGPE